MPLPEDVYGISRPTVADVHGALGRVLGDAGGVWAGLLHRTGLDGTEADTASVKALLTAMFAAGGVTALCARSVQIRLSTCTHLAAARDLIGAAA